MNFEITTPMGGFSRTPNKPPYTPLLVAMFILISVPTLSYILTTKATQDYYKYDHTRNASIRSEVIQEIGAGKCVFAEELNASTNRFIEFPIYNYKEGTKSNCDILREWCPILNETPSRECHWHETHRLCECILR